MREDVTDDRRVRMISGMDVRGPPGSLDHGETPIDKPRRIAVSLSGKVKWSLTEHPSLPV